MKTTIKLLKSSLIGATIFCTIFIVFNFVKPIAEVSAQEQARSEESSLVEIIAKPKKGYKTDKAVQDIQSLDFDRVTIKSEYQLGDQIQTDFIIKTNEDDILELEREIDNYRGGFLHNLETAPSVTDDKKNIKKATNEQVLSARKSISSSLSDIKELKFLTKTEKKESLKNKLETSRSFDSIVEQELKKERVKEDRIHQSAKKTGSNLKSIFGPLKTDAQSIPDWVPDFSSVNFFDMDEVGTWVDSIWNHNGGLSNAQPSVTFGNGRMYVAVRGDDNRVYVGNWDSNGGDFQGWNEVGNNWVTPSAPTIEWYWGRLYVGIRGTNNTAYYKYSTNGGASWTGWSSMGGQIDSGMDFETYGNKLYAAARGLNNNRLYINTLTNGINNWSGWQIRGSWQTIDKPVLARHNNNIYFGIRGIDNKAYVNINTLNWSDNDWREVRNGTDESFGMASIGSQLCFLFRNPNNDIVQGCNPDSNLTNSTFTIESHINSEYPPTLGKDWNLMQIVVGGELPSNEIRHRRLGFTLGSRGYLTEMLWNDGSSGFEENSAYEQRISLGNGENSGFQTYLDKQTSPWALCLPEARYIHSSLPNLYLDTRAQQGITNQCDNESDEITYTIGSSYPKLINSNTLYRTYWVDGKGQKNRPRYTLRFQKGEMRPDWCFDASACPNTIDSNTRYECNSADGDVFCSWMRECEGDCDGYTAWNYSDSDSFDRTNTYPYWYEVFNK